MPVVVQSGFIENFVSLSLSYFSEGVDITDPLIYLAFDKHCFTTVTTYLRTHILVTLLCQIELLYTW